MNTEPDRQIDTGAAAVIELLGDLHRSGATICMVTRDSRFARHADRTIHLFDGQVVDEEGHAAQPTAAV